MYWAIETVLASDLQPEDRRERERHDPVHEGDPAIINSVG